MTVNLDRWSLEETTQVMKQSFPFLVGVVSPREFQVGMHVELEHGTIYPETNITNDDPVLTGKIVAAHLMELPDYYSRLIQMEEEGEEALEEMGVQSPAEDIYSGIFKKLI